LYDNHLFIAVARMTSSVDRPGTKGSADRLPPRRSTNIFGLLLSFFQEIGPPFSTRSPLDRIRRHSVAFLEREGETWACFLVTFLGPDHRWHGYFSFRPKSVESQDDEVRTADIFREASEAEIRNKARGLGRPLLSGLLASALHTRDDQLGESPRLRRWFRTMLTHNSRGLAGDWPPGKDEGERTLDLGKLRSLYASYRLDQVCHFIALVQPDDFEDAVNQILEGKPMDFGSKDVLQFAMMVVEFIELHLPLPPFEVWAEDFLGHQGDYALYSHTLHREGRLP